MTSVRPADEAPSRRQGRRALGLIALAVCSAALTAWFVYSPGPWQKPPAPLLAPAANVSEQPLSVTPTGAASAPVEPAASEPVKVMAPATQLREEVVDYPRAVDEALASGDGPASMAAARLFSDCRAIEVRLQAWYGRLHGGGHAPKADSALEAGVLDAMRQMIASDELRQRRCQALTAWHWAQGPRLLANAARQGVYGAASDWWREMPRAPETGQPQGEGATAELLAALQRDALLGDDMAMVALACEASFDAVLSNAQWASYARAAQLISAGDKPETIGNRVLLSHCARAAGLVHAARQADPAQVQRLVQAYAARRARGRDDGGTTP